MGFSTEEVAFKNGDITLAETFAIPQDKTGRHPAVVIISGSGPQGRDGNLLARRMKYGSGLDKAVKVLL